MKKSQKIKVFDFAVFQAILFSQIGLFAGIIYSFGGFIIDSLVTFDFISTDETTGLSIGTILAFGAIIGMPAIAFIIGFVTGLIESIVFNIFLSRIHGFKTGIEE
ncbi:hypothetical protein HZR84_04675 [Hyphobacterium sp. CCMP332]|nr:hypothetical protein HZR84_04675 [Hyphobacterium sp. CCMP332]